jgi:hypothetical protein
LSDRWKDNSQHNNNQQGCWETKPFGAWPRLIVLASEKLVPFVVYMYTASSQPPAAYSV